MRPPAEIEKAAAPYFGQLVTKIMVSGNNVTPTEEIINVLKTKPGMTLTSEGLGKDLYAIYNMGWFYDLQPNLSRFRKVCRLPIMLWKILFISSWQ